MSTSSCMGTETEAMTKSQPNGRPLKHIPDTESLHGGAIHHLHTWAANQGPGRTCPQDTPSPPGSGDRHCHIPQTTALPCLQHPHVRNRLGFLVLASASPNGGVGGALATVTPGRLSHTCSQSPFGTFLKACTCTHPASDCLPHLLSQRSGVSQSYVWFAAWYLSATSSLHPLLSHVASPLCVFPLRFSVS